MDLPNKAEPPKDPAKKHVEQVVTGASLEQRPATKRFFGALFQENPRAVGANIGRTVIVPRLKAGLEEAIGHFVGGMLWGGGQRPTSSIVQNAMLRPPGGMGPGMNYGAMSGTPTPAILAAQSATSAPSAYQNVVLPDEDRAKAVLANLYDLFNQYRVVTVGDLYESCGLTPQTAHNSLGWRSLEGARITIERDGCVLQMPRPTHL